MKKIITGIVIVIALAAVAYFFLPSYFSVKTPNTGTVSIMDFNSCAGAGYPILETSPRQCQTPDGRTFTEAQNQPGTTTASGDHSDLITVSNVASGQKVTSPLTVEGKARGGWYFEASFPVELKDANGKVLFQGPAQAQGDWMTSDFVPFKVTLTFTKPTTKTGTLTLKKDNPSGDPVRDDSISIPVTF
jgi:hypothetical protein